MPLMGKNTGPLLSRVDHKPRAEWDESNGRARSTRARSTRKAAKAPTPQRNTPDETPTEQLKNKGILSDSESADSDLEDNPNPLKRGSPSSSGKENAGSPNTYLSNVGRDEARPKKSPRLEKTDEKTTVASNFHAHPPRRKRTMKIDPTKQYGRAGNVARAKAARVKSEGRNNELGGFQQPKSTEMPEKQSPPKKFQGFKPTSLTDSDTPRSAFLLPSSLASAPPSSCEVVDLENDALSDAEVEELTTSDQDSTPRCDLCEAPIDPYTKEQFEDEYHLRKTDWNYKWQTRFCEYHTHYEGRQTWKDKGYPEIDWAALPRRLRKREHLERVKSILEGRRSSRFREQQEEVVKSRNRTLQQSVENEGGRRGGAGYYGYRGERLLSEHIMQHFGSDLRARATRDKVITAAGVSGGLSGFVNAVLVPELAVGLIIEDLGKTESEAMDILTESAELGEVMHPEVDDQTKEVIELDD